MEITSVGRKMDPGTRWGAGPPGEPLPPNVGRNRPLTTPSESPPCGTTDWGQFRRQMPVAGRWAYFDHAAVAPLSGPARGHRAAGPRTPQPTARPSIPRLDEADRATPQRGGRPDRGGPGRDRPGPQHHGRHQPGGRGLPWEPGDNVVLPTTSSPRTNIPGCTWPPAASRFAA